jgi:asparagine N-glycosylation enzyme membrane subunit Stt3
MIDKRGSISGHERKETQPKEIMLWTIFVILLILWLLGFIGGYAFGGAIHLLLVIAVVILIINLIQGRRTL